MANAQDVMTQVVLRYRTNDYLRFSLPEELCREDIARFLEQGLHQVEGVRRVVVHGRRRKLSVFCLPNVCEFPAVVRKLRRLIELLAEHGWMDGPSAPPSDVLMGPFKGIRTRYRAWKARKISLGSILRAQWKVNPVLRLMGHDPEKSLVSFSNDLVTFYLIRRHWNLIMTQWLKNPFQFRYEWLTTFYLILLLVRSRRKA